MQVQGQPKSRFAEFLQKIGASLLKLFGGEFLVFLLFLVITLFFWWSRTMSLNYQTVVKVPVSITHIPENIRVTSQPSSHLSIMMSGKGSALRKASRKGRKHELVIDNSMFSINHGHASLSTYPFKDSLSALLPPQVVINDIEPDSITYGYQLQCSKMLPVCFEGVTSSTNQFSMERVEFDPDSVMSYVLLSDTVTHRIVAQIHNVPISSDTTVMEVALQPIDGVLWTTDKVQMTIIAQQYTEKSIEVPITGVNFPDYITLKSFPSKAIVTLWVKMSEYDKVDVSDFEVAVDYTDIVEKDNSKAVLRIYSQPAYVRNVRLQTRTVDYFMESAQY